MTLVIEQECGNCKTKHILKFFFWWRGKQIDLCDECAKEYRNEFNQFVLNFLNIGE